VEKLTPADFHGKRLARPGDFLVLFDASWCPFSREFRPRFLARDGTIPATLAHADVSADSNPLWEEFSIEIVPTLIAFREGAVLARWDGIQGEGLGEGHLDAAGALFRRAAPAPRTPSSSGSTAAPTRSVGRKDAG
jgi:thioredoxin-like negative regulator of GroEL